MCQKVEDKIFQNYTAETKVQDVCTFMKNTNISYEKCKIRDILRSHASHLIKKLCRELCFFALFSDFNSIFSSVASNIKPLDTRLFLLGKLCVRARSKFESVIFCVLVLTRDSNQMNFLQFLVSLGVSYIVIRPFKTHISRIYDVCPARCLNI